MKGSAAHRRTDDIRDEWRTAAPGWERWMGTMETEDGGRAVSRRLVDLARVAPGDIVLDLGSGYGEPGLLAARAVMPGGQVILQDIAGDMLDVARRRLAASDLDDVDVHIVESDAEQLELPAASVDAIVSRAAIMYLADVVGSLARLRRILKPGGSFAASVWGPPETVGFAACLPVILDALGLDPPPPDGPGPFALSDPARLTDVVQQAGFVDVETGSIPVIWEFDSPEACTAFVRDVAPPVTALVADRPPDVQLAIWEQVTEQAWASFVGSDGRVFLSNQANWVAGIDPA